MAPKSGAAEAGIDRFDLRRPRRTLQAIQSGKTMLKNCAMQKFLLHCTCAPNQFDYGFGHG